MSDIRSALCLWTVTSLTAGPAFADNPDDPITVGEPIIVTATRTAQTIDDTLASVTVITGEEEIERRQPNSAPAGGPITPMNDRRPRETVI